MRLLRQGMYGRIEYGSVREHALILYEADVLNLEYLTALFRYYQFIENYKDEGKKIYKDMVMTLRPWDEQLYHEEIKGMEEELQGLNKVKLSSYFKVNQRIIEDNADYLMEALSKNVPYQK